LVELGLLTTYPQPGKEFDSELTMGPFVVALPDGGAAAVRGVLVLGVDKSRSTLLPNLMRGLRSQLQNPGPLALDGDDNLVPPFSPDYPAYLAQQLQAAETIVDSVVAMLAAAAGSDPTALRGKVWVQHAEVCQDHYVENAIGYVDDLTVLPIPGARAQRLNVSVDRDRNKLCLSWNSGTQTSPVTKLYPKCEDRVRVELVLRARPAVRHLLKQAGTPAAADIGLTGAAVARELELVARAAFPLIDAVLVWTDTIAQVMPRSGTDLVVALQPLLRLVAPAPRPAGAAGRLPNADGPDRARRAFDSLINQGQFDARGLGTRDAVLVALQAMQEAGTLVTPAGGGRLFSVAPAFESARAALAAARHPPPEDEPWLMR
jgi:hypothetical protein